MQEDDIVAKPLDVTDQIRTQRCAILTLDWIPFTDWVMQQTTDIDDALGDDCFDHQVVLVVTYRHQALHGGFEFPNRDALLIHRKPFLPQG